MTKYPNGIDDSTTLPPVTPDSIGPLVGPPGPQGPAGPRGVPGPPGGLAVGVNVKNHGTFLPNNPYTAVNFTGTGVTTTDVSGVATINITGGGGGGGFTPGGDLTGDGVTQIVSFIRGIVSPDPAFAVPNSVFTIAPPDNLWAGAAGIVYDGQYLWVSDGESSGVVSPPSSRVKFIRIIDPVPEPPVLIDSIDLSAYFPYQNVRFLRMSDDNTKVYVCIKGWDGTAMPSGGSQFSAPDGNGDQIITDLGGNFFSQLVGATITVTGANTGDNGTFLIKSFIDSTQITIHNPGGTLDTDTSSWTTNAIPGRVLIFDKTTRTIIGNAEMKNGIIGTDASVATGARAVVELAGTLWVTNSNQQTGNIVEKFDLATVLANGTTPTFSFDFVNTDRHSDVLCVADGFIWTAGGYYTDDITRIDPGDNSISIFTCLPSGTGGTSPFIGQYPLFGALWAGDGGENIMRFDTSQFPNPGFRTDVVDLLPTGTADSAQFQFVSDGTFVWHGNIGGSGPLSTLYKIDPTPGSVAIVATIDYHVPSGSGNGQGAAELVFDGTNVWATIRYAFPSSIAKFDITPGSESFILSFSAPQSPLIYKLPAFIFDDNVTTSLSNIRSTKTHAAPIDNTKTGIICLSADSNNLHYGVFNDYGTIGGGNQNYVAGDFGTISGGFGNIISGGTHASITGGLGNVATGAYSVVAGGTNNTVQNTCDAIVGGQNNNIASSSGNSGIFAGQLNTINGSLDSCAIIAGLQNQIINSSGNNCVIIGGGFNTVQNTAVDSVIVGGQFNNITSTIAGIIGAANCSVNGNHSVIAGGQSNTTNGDWSAILGGDGNLASGNASVAIGGFSLTTSSGVAQILAGGQNNTITSPSGQNGIFAGQSNSIVSNAVNSVIIGGVNNVVSSANAFVHGFGARAFRSGQYGQGSPAGVNSSTQTSQYARMVLAGTSTNGGAVNLLLSTTGGDEITLENHQYYSGRVTVIAARNDAAGGPATFIHTFVAHQTGGTAVLDLDTVTTSFTNGTAWTFTLTVTSNILRLTFTGTAGQIVRALATVEWTELPAF